MNNNNNNLPAVVNFNFNGFTIRHVKDNDGKIWFVAKDIAQKLGYSEASNPARLFGAVPEEWKGVKRIHTPGGEQDMLCVTENGAYFFLARSDKPGALEFQMWLARDVVPSIMHTGEYVHPALKAATRKPAPVPSDIKIYLSKANFSAQERIINRAVDAKYLVDAHDDNADRECQKVLALDLAFRKRTGYSALEAAGIKIEVETRGATEHIGNWMAIEWSSKFNVYFTNTRLDLPAPYSEEHVFEE